jgi:HPt (histidine-containing phosphotransfer) domain-containing protein
MTANAMIGDKEKCLKAGMNDYLVKPIDTKKLFDILAKWIPNIHVELSILKPKSAILPDNLPGINTKSGLERLEKNHQLYIKLLKDFYKSYHNVIETITNLSRDEKIADIIYIIHSIKGVSANLSINKVYEIATNLETNLKTKNKLIPELFIQFESAIIEVMDTISSLEINDSDANFSSGETNIIAIKPLVLELSDLLNEYNSRAIDVLPNIKPYLNENLREIYQQLEDKLDTFEFDEAKEVLTKLNNEIFK